MRLCITYSFILLLVATVAVAQRVDSITVSPADSSRIFVKRLSINSSRSDFSPVLFNNTLFFASARPSHVGVKYANDNNSDITDLFYASRRDSVTFGKVQPLTSVNTRYNEGPFAMGANGNVIYFSGNDQNKKDKTPQGLQIYVAEKNNGRWGKPVVAGFCDNSGSNCHPAFSANEQTLLFCSDRPGGYGGMDIYMTQKKDGAWTSPVNLGPGVNTSANELFPQLCGAQLYFASQRPNGFGGLDIYKADFGNKTASTATLLEAPINSASDDFGIWLDTTGHSGYFSSNRLTTTGDDIFYFASVYPDFNAAATPVVKNKFCYSFFEESGYTSNDSVSLAYEWNFGDGTKTKAEKCRHCFSKPGNYVIQLNVVEKSSGEISYNQTTYTLTVDAPPQLIIDCHDSVGMNEPLVIDASQSQLKGYKLLDFYWAFGDGTYNKGLATKHSYGKAGQYDVELVVKAVNQETQQSALFKIKKHIAVHDNG